MVNKFNLIGLLFFFLGLALVLPAQGEKFQDSVESLVKLSDHFADNVPLSNYYSNKALRIADSIHYVKGQIKAYYGLGQNLLVVGEFHKAAAVFEKAVGLCLESGNLKSVAIYYNLEASSYYYLGDFEKALKAYLEGIKYAISRNDNATLVTIYTGMANIYLEKEDYPGALKKYNEALELATKLKDLEYIASIENSLGNVEMNRAAYTKALPHFQKALTTYIGLNDSLSVARMYVNLGGTYSGLKNYTLAKGYYAQALRVYEKKNNQQGLILCYIDMGSTYASENNVEEGLKYYALAAKNAQAIGLKIMEKKCYESLAELYGRKGNYKDAFNNYKSFVKIKDSLLNEANSKNLNELQTKYETEKKDIENKKLSLENDNKATKIRQNTLLNYFYFSIILLGAIILIIIYRQFKQKQQANIQLEAKNTAIRRQKREIEEQNKTLEYQHKEITDSINYANQIQQAILPNESLLKALPNFFILFKPKSVVSGDFYFFVQLENAFIYAAVDCTGHGVPGAFMSMIGNNLLNQVIKEKKIHQPDEILNHLHLGVRSALHQDNFNSENRDGMDIGLIKIHADFKTMEFAGANRPLYLIRNKTLIEIKGDKKSIGGIQDELERKFTNHLIPLEKGDAMYVFSDGYADQFGGPLGKKMMVKNLQKLLIENAYKPSHEQKHEYDNAFEAWKGDLEQVDDILLMGLNI